MKRLGWLLGLLLLIGGGLYVGWPPAELLPPENRPAPLLWPELAGREAQVQQLELRRDGLPPVQLKRTASGWQLAALGYPARGEQVEALLQALGQARLQGERTAKADNHARLGLALKGEGAALALRLEPVGGPRTLLIGELSQRGGQLVRWQDEDQVWLVDRNLQLPASELQWLDRRLVSLPAGEIRVLRIVHKGGRRLQLARSAPLQDLQGGGLPVATANALGGLFTDLQALDLLPTDQLGFAGKPLLELRLETFAGGWLEAQVYQQGGHYWLLLGESGGLEPFLHWQMGWAARIEAPQYQLLAATGE